MSDKPREQGFARRTREYAAMLIPVLRFVARSCGYALAVHGSLSYDIDLIACPWVDIGAGHPISAEALADRINDVVKAVIGCELKTDGPTPKPHGRIAWSFHLGGGPYIDLSVMPRIIKKEKR